MKRPRQGRPPNLLALRPAVALLLPDFDAGIIAAVLRRVGVEAAVTVAERGAERAVLRVQW
jgi:lysophospholipid acyltransferase (LPLAT)-like uncharacterized protein